MSETKSLAAPKASFDRRAVVKGAAWSVPVIAAAIAAPAAAASHTGTPHTGSVTMALAARVGNVPFTGSPKRTATVSTGFTIANTTGTAVPAGVVVKVTITGSPQVGLTAMSGGGSGTGSTYAAGAYTIYFATSTSIAPGANQLFSFSGFFHEAGNDKTAHSYNFKVTFSIPGNPLEDSSTLSLNA